MKNILVVLLLGLLIVACNDTKETTSSKQEPILIKYMDSLYIVNQHPAWETDAPGFKFEYNYLIFAPGNGEVGEKIDRVCYEVLCDNSLVSKLDSAVYQASANDLVESFYTRDSLKSPQKWFVKADMNLAVNKQNILGLELNKESFTDGLASTKRRIFINFRIEDGKVLNLSDVIADEHFDEFEKLAEFSFRKQYNIDQTVTWNQTPFVMFANGFRLNDNFLILETGLLFVFNPFDASTRSHEQYQMIVPWSSIEHLVSEESIVKNFITNNEKSE
jgi:hypothetical protein